MGKEILDEDIITKENPIRTAKIILLEWIMFVISNSILGCFILRMWEGLGSEELWEDQWELTKVFFGSILVVCFLLLSSARIFAGRRVMLEYDKGDLEEINVYDNPWLLLTTLMNWCMTFWASLLSVFSFGVWDGKTALMYCFLWGIIAIVYAYYEYQIHQKITETQSDLSKK